MRLNDGIFLTAGNGGKLKRFNHGVKGDTPLNFMRRINPIWLIDAPSHPILDEQIEDHTHGYNRFFGRPAKAVFRIQPELADWTLSQLEALEDGTAA